MEDFNFDFDLPATLETTDASPFSSESAPYPDSDVPLLSQPEDAEVEAVDEALNGNADETGIADKPVNEILRECVPEGSNSVLETMVHSRQGRAKVGLKSSKGHPIVTEYLTPGDALGTDRRHSTHA